MNARVGIMILALLFLTNPSLARPPIVVSSTIDDGQDDVDPALAELRITFDQPMNPKGQSIVGGGPTFPDITAAPTWADARTIVIPISLVPDHEYWLSINSDTYRNFTSRTGEPAVPQPIAFRTRAADAPTEPANPLSAEQNRAAIDALKRAIDDHYAYRDRLQSDWAQLFEQHDEAIRSAKTPNQFARAAAKLLRNAGDGHVYVRAGERTIATHVNAKPPNFDLRSIHAVVADLKEHGPVAMGRLAPDIGYFLIAEWSDAASEPLERAFDDVKDAKSLIIDVRMNGGGDEIAAREFAGRFLDEPKVYSRNRIRSDGQWTGPFDRVVEPALESERYDGQVAVLIGPKVASSCESFVLMMKQSPRVTLIGAPTKGSSGNPKPHDLGNGVTVYLSSWEDQTPDGALFEGIGIKPDIAVMTRLNELPQRDPVIEAAVRTLKAKR